MIPMAELPTWEKGEETASMWTHFIGIIATVIASGFVAYQQIQYPDTYKLIGNIIYLLSMLNLYTFSTLYHGVTDEKVKKILRYGDHISIFYLIAGSYAPLCLTKLRDSGGIIILAIVWAIAFIGTFLKIMWFDKVDKYTVLLFVLMGWTIIFRIWTLFKKLPLVSCYWLVLGGVSYTIGTFFYSRDTDVPFFHAIWHLFVLLGSVGIFLCTYLV